MAFTVQGSSDRHRNPNHQARAWLFGLLAAFTLTTFGHAQPSSAVPVTAAPVTRADVPVLLRGLGTVQALNAVTIKARVDGTLMDVKVTEGQEVHKGELVAVIDPRPYQAALDAAMAKRAQDEALLNNAQRDLARYSSLATRDFASRQQVETQQATVAQASAAMKGDDALISTAKLNLSFCYLLAPIDGRVGLRQIDPGNLVRAGDSGGIISIAQLHPIALVFTLPQDTLPRIVAAMAEGTLPVRAYSGDDKTELGVGELLTPDNAIDTATGTIRLKATFANPDNRLWPGQFVNARLLVATRHGCADHPVGGGAARPVRLVRLRGQARPDGGAPGYRGRAGHRHRGRGRQRAASR